MTWQITIEHYNEETRQLEQRRVQVSDLHVDRSVFGHDVLVLKFKECLDSILKARAEAGQ